MQCPLRPRPLSAGDAILVSWSQQPAETAAASCAGTEHGWQEADSSRAVLLRHRHQHPASLPPCRQQGLVLGPHRGSSCPGQDGPGQLLLWLQVGSPRASRTCGHGRAPQHQQPSSCPPLSSALLCSALQGGSQRRRAAAERGCAAEPGPQEQREAPSPAPGGSGGRQAAVRA